MATASAWAGSRSSAATAKYALEVRLKLSFAELCSKIKRQILTFKITIGRQNLCINNEQFGTANHDQGTFATGIAWDVSALFKVPDGIASEDAGPLMCGGATVWDPLFSNGARAGDRIGIVGIGGLGHLAIQFASKMAFQAVVFSRSESKREEAMSFGATEYHATEGRDSLEGITPVDYLLITANTLPDLTP